MNISGKYKLSSSENFDEYLKALGVSSITRKLAHAAPPTTEINQNGDEYVITTVTSFKTTEIKFKLGEEFDEITGDETECKSVITLEDGNKLVHHQYCSSQQSTIVWDFEGDQMTVTLKVGEVACTRVYIKVE